MKIQSDKYKNIYYSVFIDRTSPDVGTGGTILLAPAASVSCSIKVSECNFDNCDEISIVLCYKQVSSKAKRSVLVLQKPEKSSVLYRHNLISLLQTYAKPTEAYEESKPLLLNDLIKDKTLGDTFIQPMFHFTKTDGTHTFMLNPGSPIEQLSFTIGMSLFEANSITEVLDSIIFTMSNLFVDNIVPISNIENTAQLLDDIQKYLHFYVYGD